MRILKKISLFIIGGSSILVGAQTKERIKLNPKTNSPYYYNWEFLITNKNHRSSSSKDFTANFLGTESLTFEKNPNKTFKVTEQILDLSLKFNEKVQFSLSRNYFKDYPNIVDEITKNIKSFKHSFYIDNKGKIYNNSFLFPKNDSKKPIKELEKIKAILKSTNTNLDLSYVDKEIKLGSSWIVDKKLKLLTNDSIIFKTTYFVKNITNEEALFYHIGTAIVPKTNDTIKTQGTTTIDLATGIPLRIRTHTTLKDNTTISSNIEKVSTSNSNNSNYVKNAYDNGVFSYSPERLKNRQYQEIPFSQEFLTSPFSWYKCKKPLFLNKNDLVQLNKGLKKTYVRGDYMVDDFIIEKDLTSISYSSLPFKEYIIILSSDSLINLNTQHKIPLLNKAYKSNYHDGNTYFSNGRFTYLHDETLSYNDSIKLFYSIHFPVSTNKMTITKKNYFKKNLSNTLPFKILKFSDTIISIRGKHRSLSFYNSLDIEIQPSVLGRKSSTFHNTEYLSGKSIDNISNIDLFLYQQTDKNEGDYIYHYYFHDKVKTLTVEYIDQYQKVSDEKIIFRNQKEITKYSRNNNLEFKKIKTDTEIVIDTTIGFNSFGSKLPLFRNSLFAKLSIDNKVYDDANFDIYPEHITINQYTDCINKSKNEIKIIYPTEVNEIEIQNNSDYLQKVDASTFKILSSLSSKKHLQKKGFFCGKDEFDLELEYDIKKENEGFLLKFKGIVTKISIPIFKKWKEVKVSTNEKGDNKL
ncbi:hypothetical protein [Aquimarina sediminis]|uniref:hypothetical protein n=1 Tax=Aquimarina sediminis TaxID=2070536 RepID=UPI000CA0286A|nr:hypothetical protein [Aquimarina sediminis]